MLLEDNDRHRSVQIGLQVVLVHQIVTYFDLFIYYLFEMDELRWTDFIVQYIQNLLEKQISHTLQAVAIILQDQLSLAMEYVNNPLQCYLLSLLHTFYVAWIDRTQITAATQILEYKELEFISV